MKASGKLSPVSVRFFSSFREPSDISNVRELYFTVGNTTFQVSDSLSAFSIEQKQKVRYITLTIPKDTFALYDVSFYEKEEDGLKRIPGGSLSASAVALHEEESLHYIIDGLSASGFKGFFLRKAMNYCSIWEKNTKWKQSIIAHTSEVKCLLTPSSNFSFGTMVGFQPESNPATINFLPLTVRRKIP